MPCKSGPFDIGQGAQFSAALKDGAEQRYRLAELFDGKSETSLSIAAPDRELNVLVSFAGDTAQPVNLIEYVPPSGNTDAAATQLDVMVLPEGLMDTSWPAHSKLHLADHAGQAILRTSRSRHGQGRMAAHRRPRRRHKHRHR